MLAAQELSSEAVGTDVTFGSITAGDVVAVKVFVWYEGNDTYCTSANATLNENISIELAFAIAN